MIAILNHRGIPVETVRTCKTWAECIEFAQVMTALLTPTEKSEWTLVVNFKLVPHSQWA